jgi:quercetin dioxygenase-like cupin family protein
MSEPQPFVVRPQECTPLRVVGETVAVLADAEKTGSVEIFLQQGAEGAGPPLHTHAWDEAYYVMEGQVDVRMGDRVATLSAGDFAFIPGGTLHNFQMRGKAVKFISVNSHGEASKFFASIDRDVGGAMNIPKIVETAARHQISVPPPRPPS